MPGEKNLDSLLKTMNPVLNQGDYVFCISKDGNPAIMQNTVMTFKEAEGFTYILDKNIADTLQLDYSFVAAWITLTVHSSLEAVGLTAAFSKALADENISCNVVAAFFHDHLFVDKKDAEKTMQVLRRFS
jgi:hypothetical protein